MNEKPKIEYTYPLPPVWRGRPTNDCVTPELLSEMEVGGSFFVPFATTSNNPSNQVISVRNRLVAWALRKRLPGKYTVRKVEGGMRVWRIS